MIDFFQIFWQLFSICFFFVLKVNVAIFFVSYVCVCVSFPSVCFLSFLRASCIALLRRLAKRNRRLNKAEADERGAQIFGYSHPYP